VETVVTNQQSPYGVELIGENGGVLDTYKHRGRFYVEGDSGERYSIRITNPTDRRVEAVVSVDGLDVIDGETADFRKKRGYVVQPHDALVIDGFRVSTRQVAAFRFSSVSNSYAGRKGKARNVGVVGVAIFAERGEPVMILPQGEPPRPRPVPRPRDFRKYDLNDDIDMDEEAPAPSVKSGAADRPSAAPPRVSKSAPAPRGRSVRPSSTSSSESWSRTRRRERPGLGTAFGERRQSAVRFTRFVRATPNKPTAYAELRYNDAPGLEALGIQLIRRGPDADELATRETADPFPGSHFAQPPTR
jgi:hypothetical protein